MNSLARSLARSLLVVLALAALAVPAAASAATVSINGSPLQIFTDSNGAVQVGVGGRLAGNYEFFPQFSTSGNAGFGVVIDPGGQNPIAYGAYDQSQQFPTASSGPTLTPGNPATITSQWTLQDATGANALRVQQVLSYRNGDHQFDSTYTVTNVSPSTTYTIRPFVGGDLAIRGSDSGVGIANLDPSHPPRYVGGLNQDVGGTGVFVEETPWTHFEEGPYYTVASNAGGPGLDNTVDPNTIDNGAAVQWDSRLASGQSAVYRVAWRFVDTFGIAPAAATQPTGNSQSFTATVGDINGNRVGANVPVIWSVSGANNTSPRTTRTDSNGQTSFSYVGGVPGQDQVTGFADLNHNHQHDANEPQGTATVNWTGPPPPVQGESFNVRPVKGTVLVKLPKGSSVTPRAAKRLGVSPQVATKSFQQLTGNIQIPLGSTLNTKHGIVRLLAASSPTHTTGGSPFSGGSFHGGLFRTGQIGGKGLTQLTALGGGLKHCGTKVPKGGAPKVIAARRRHHRRRLFGNAHGRFRTRGRNSSATVRGTRWVQKDSCKGTLTSVKRGTVVVRDFAKHRRKVVHKGHHYLARALRRH